MTCPTCGQSTDSLSAETVDLLVDWDGFDYASVGDVEYVTQLGDVEVVAIHTGSTDSYGYVIDGTAWVVVKVQRKYFKKAGTKNSYSGLSWDGDCREVKAEPKTVTVFDYVV